MARPVAPSREHRASSLDPKLASGTPPETDAFPLTPPTSCDSNRKSDHYVGNYIRRLEACRDPHVADPTVVRVELPPGDYDKAARELKRRPSLNGYVEDKVRLNYEPATRRVEILMPAPVHDVFSTSVANQIHQQLQQIASRPDEDGAFAAQIISGGSSRIILESAVGESRDEEPSGHEDSSQEPRPVGNVIQRHPDAQFQHARAGFPGVVIEVSYSQAGKDLERLAWDYIQYSNGDIKAVIGLDIYHGVKPSTVSVWRPEYTREEGDEFDTLGVHADIAYQAFRSPDLSPANGEREIRLTLDDFTTDALTIGSDTSVRIGFDKLAELLRHAEDVQRAREQGAGGGVKSKRILKKRRRSSSSAERILSDDETLFRARESTAMDKSDAQDEDFRPAVRRKI